MTTSNLPWPAYLSIALASFGTRDATVAVAIGDPPAAELGHALQLGHRVLHGLISCADPDIEGRLLGPWAHDGLAGEVIRSRILPRIGWLVEFDLLYGGGMRALPEASSGRPGRITGFLGRRSRELQ